MSVESGVHIIRAFPMAATGLASRSLAGPLADHWDRLTTNRRANRLAHADSRALADPLAAIVGSRSASSNFSFF